MEKLDATNDNVSHPSGLKSDSSVLELATVREVEKRWMCCFFWLLLFTPLRRPSVRSLVKGLCHTIVLLCHAIDLLCHAIVVSFFFKLLFTCLRINWIPKLIFQFCYLRAYLGIEIGFCRMFVNLFRPFKGKPHIFINCSGPLSV